MGLCGFEVSINAGLFLLHFLVSLFLLSAALQLQLFIVLVLVRLFVQFRLWYCDLEIVLAHI